VGAEEEVLVETQGAEIAEMRLQAQTARRQHDAALEEARRESRELSERCGAAERRSAQLTRETAQLQEQLGQAADEAEAAAGELTRLREVEARFSELAAEMGCVDEQGRMMQQRLQGLTGELVQARGAAPRSSG